MYPKKFFDLLNGIPDPAYVLKVLSEFFHADAVLVIKFYGQENPYGPSYREVYGINAVVQFIDTFFFALPDSIFRTQEKKLILRQDGTSYIMCRYTFNGTRLYKIATTGDITDKTTVIDRIPVIKAGSRSNICRCTNCSCVNCTCGEVKNSVCDSNDALQETNNSVASNNQSSSIITKCSINPLSSKTSTIATITDCACPSSNNGTSSVAPVVTEKKRLYSDLTEDKTEGNANNKIADPKKETGVLLPEIAESSKKTAGFYMKEGERG